MATRVQILTFHPLRRPHAPANHQTHPVTDPAPFSLAVIGHVNHGKTALVRALTGIETDRLPEEKARGLSITTGFAWRDYPGASIDFLDAPGHEDFIRAMVMATAGARAVLLVVSATEGFGRQTHEHLRIAGLLGLTTGVIAVSKADLAPQDAWPDIEAQVRAALAGTVLAAEPLVFCAATTGAGLDRLSSEIAGLVARSPLPAPPPGAWLPLDRVFSLAGAGAVATGSLQGGSLAMGQETRLLPSGRRISLRQLQVHGQPVVLAQPGGRVAAALRGVSAAEIKPGEVLCAPGLFEASRLIDVEITLSPDSARPLKSNDELRVMWGARQDMASLRLMDGPAIAPGGRGLAQMRFAQPVIAHTGLRAILRRPSPAETIGGALVLDPVAPPLRARTLEARRDLLAAAAGGRLQAIADQLAHSGNGVLSLVDLARLARRPLAGLEADLKASFKPMGEGLMAAPQALAQARQAYLDHLAEAHGRQPTRPGLPLGSVRSGLSNLPPALVAHVERALALTGDIRLEVGLVALRGHDPLAALSPQALSRLGQIEAEVRAGGLSPPDIRALEGQTPEDPALVTLLIDTGRLVSLYNHALRQTLTFHAEAFDQAVADLRAAFPPPTLFTTGQARAALNTSRKFIVPVLELLDRRGDTVRQGDQRHLTSRENPLPVPPEPI